MTLGGNLDEKIVGGLSQEQHLPYHTVGDAKVLHGANSADILLTACWPASIRTGSKVVIPSGSDAVLPPLGLQHISELCAALKPRYHFSASPSIYYNREPFFHKPSLDEPDVRPITRFISIADYGNKLQKTKFAFTLSPLDPSAPLPDGCTASPFIVAPTDPKGAAGSIKRSRGNLEADPFESQHPSRYQRSGRGHRRPQLPGPDQCFFCIANETVSQHLVCSIGDHSYITTAKGPLTTREIFSDVGLTFPGHILIIPLAHESVISLINEADSPDSKTDTFNEMTQYRTTLQKMIAKVSSNKLGSVTYEISRAYGVHNQWQFVPVLASTITADLVEAAFKVEAENLRYPEFEVRDPGLGEKEGDFFRVWIYTPPTEENKEGSTKCLLLPLNDSVRFSLQFGRQVLAKLMGLERRFQWRDCDQTQAEEVVDVEAFKTAFKDFDFTS